jgi:hypothetical protein
VRDDVGCPTEQRIVVHHAFSNSSSALISQTNVCDAVGATVSVFAADVDGDAPARAHDAQFNGGRAVL